MDTTINPSEMEKNESEDTLSNLQPYLDLLSGTVNVGFDVLKEWMRRTKENRWLSQMLWWGFFKSLCLTTYC
ncbi:hypothetical protein H1P_6330004 [Hyella patelloides LEGE 07179]|uniref:Uncharacterized protein n=1 Tax=Hyella patelloides LEGE 07179 TaxID=945734 RepID=A0A563W1X6_9CYAN|nr:hypothetical protein H1P_6330004 [Hyella patelloides LEGE 07179]